MHLYVNNIPAKVCSYACVYCQFGKTLHNQIERTSFYRTDDLIASAKMRIEAAKEKNETIDYLAFVHDGEPTLDIHLCDKIEVLHEFGIKNFSTIRTIISYNNITDANPRKLKKPTMSVTVAKSTVDPIAGSTPNFLSVRGITTPKNRQTIG